MNKIKVDVMGYTGTGKSTIIQVIEEALFAAGLKSVVISDTRGHLLAPELHARNVELLKNHKTMVEITETRSSSVREHLSHE